jgi:hypothetical protein
MPARERTNAGDERRRTSPPLWETRAWGRRASGSEEPDDVLAGTKKEPTQCEGCGGERELQCEAEQKARLENSVEWEALGVQTPLD